MRHTILAAALAALVAGAAGAESAAVETAALGTAPAAEAPEVRGPVTNLPMPRFVSMKASEGYARRGPSSTHRIDWVFVRRNMPLRVVGEYGHWRRVQDREGAGGWMHYSLLSGNRTVIVEAGELLLHRRPAPEAPVAARLARGVIAWLGECAGGWCEVEVGEAEGWAAQAALWGVEPGEVRE
ncbi:SH3 domain-containing protein [Jannaschia sp. W003]|uniref:SH3 domain-containing protein n=1 Tax=Jannaschia sp. W003 TaxID=2867012 RepID=UPI0021A7F548|nr:SH3 domain-containing protein [Jannaschia sp. W003]UWQ22302.1 aspartyl-trna synthetase [Jannaschia sp. W003]